MNPKEYDARLKQCQRRLDRTKLPKMEIVEVPLGIWKDTGEAEMVKIRRYRR